MLGLAYPLSTRTRLESGTTGPLQLRSHAMPRPDFSDLL